MELLNLFTFYFILLNIFSITFSHKSSNLFWFRPKVNAHKVSITASIPRFFKSFMAIIILNDYLFFAQLIFVLTLYSTYNFTHTVRFNRPELTLLKHFNRLFIVYCQRNSAFRQNPLNFRFIISPLNKTNKTFNLPARYHVKPTTELQRQLIQQLRTTEILAEYRFTLKQISSRILSVPGNISLDQLNQRLERLQASRIEVLDLISDFTTYLDAVTNLIRLLQYKSLTKLISPFIPLSVNQVRYHTNL